MGKIKLTCQTLPIRAHRELVYQLITTIGRGKLAGSKDVSSRIISKDGDKIVAEFYTKTRWYTVTTVEEMTLYPPERIAYRWLKGPIKYVVEEFVLREAQNGGSELVHNGEFELKMPVLGWIFGRLWVKPRFEKVVIGHMEEIKEAAEARASRSHVYPQPT